MGRKLLPRWKRKHKSVIHLKKDDESSYTLCGLRIFDATTKGLRILLTFPITLKDEYGVCKNCENARDKIQSKSMMVLPDSQTTPG